MVTTFSQHCVESSGIPPGACFDYIFTVGEQTGTYWIHSHVIGQYPNGLRAPFIVHDCDPPYHYDEELVLSVSDWVCLQLIFSDVQYNQTMQVLIPEFLSPENPDGAEPVPDSKTSFYFRF
jgi:iron transport multicopper oxidase